MTALDVSQFGLVQDWTANPRVQERQLKLSYLNKYLYNGAFRIYKIIQDYMLHKYQILKMRGTMAAHD